MQLRCTYCQTMFAIGREDMLAALEHMEENKQIYYDAHCPKCRRANRVERARMERFFPDWKTAIKTMAKESAQAAPASEKPAAIASAANVAAAPKTAAKHEKKHPSKSRPDAACGKANGKNIVLQWEIGPWWDKKEMRVRAVFVDFGGVIMRTEDKGPRTRQAERLGMTYRDLEKIIFESDSSLRASTGEITEEAHWQAVAKTLGVSRQEAGRIIAEFFSGDRKDVALLDFLRSLRPEHKVGLISNAWSGLRAFITSPKVRRRFR